MLHAPSIEALLDLLRGSPCDWSMSEKLDGINATWNGESLVTRCGHVIAAPDWFVAGLPKMPLTGELWAGHGQFETVCGVVKSTANEAAWRKVRLMVFDGNCNTEFAKPVAHHACVSLDRIARFFEEVIAAGGEGVVVRDAEGTRAKLKPIVDADAEVVGHNGSPSRVQSLQVRLTDGIEFRLGSGLTNELRRNPPPIGSIVSFEHSGFTSHGVPRHASYLRTRAEMAFV